MKSNIFRAGVLPSGSVLYRYGSDERQVNPPRRVHSENRNELRNLEKEWICMSEDCYCTSREAVQKGSLVDYRLVGVTSDTKSGQHQKNSSQKPKIWNTAAYRGRFLVTDDFAVWHGVAGELNYSLYEELEYFDGHKGAHPAPSLIHRVGGGSQVMVHNDDFYTKLRFERPVVSLLNDLHVF